MTAHSNSHAKGGAGSNGGAPPGNNGTIKLDETVLTSSEGADHANHPHVTCQFALSFFGFDTGTDTAQVSFSAQPPSGHFTSVTPTVGPSELEFTVSDRTGGGQLDASVEYQLDTAGLQQQAKQGFHIRVVADVSGAKNADSKQKVFWYQPCTSSSNGSGTTTTTVPTTTVPTTTTVPSGTGTTGGSGSGGGTTASAGGSPPANQVGLPTASAPAGSAGSSVAASSAPSSAVSTSPATGVAPTGAASDLGRFDPGHQKAPGMLWWEILGGAGLLTVSGTTAVVRLRRRSAR